jgi:hypothetical protein
MYFFDIRDYYAGGGGETYFYASGSYKDAAGCIGFIKPNNWGDYFGTARETRNAFLKAIWQWFLASRVSGEAYDYGYTPIDYTPDSGCTPTYNELYVNFNYALCDWWERQEELFGTIHLHKYYYNQLTNPTFLNNNPQYYGFYSNINSHEEWISYHLNNPTPGGDEEYYTGTTTETITVMNPYTNLKSGITLTFNYGTTFEDSDLKTKVQNYENSMKTMMCSLKNMMAVMDGDTFDELAYDENLNFIPNNGKNYTYAL